ncbi:MAG TPA: type II secretion system F family protein [Anaerolineae bacterium]|nr:type II secretion system F family protein [Anaerolineae bacterium]
MTTAILIIGALVVLGGLAFLVVRVARSHGGGASIEERMAEFGTLERPPTLEELELSQPFSERVLMPLITRLADFAMRFSPAKSMEEMQHKLDLAGNPYDLKKFVGMRILAAILFGGLGIAIMFLGKSMPKIQRFALPLVGAGLGYYLPVLSLGSKIKKRQKEIIKSLPDALDLLTICVEAGLGFDAAMAKVSEKWDNELCVAFRRVIQELQLGKLRREALRDMANRMDVPDVSTFVAAIIQADQLGVSIARVLRIQSDQMRMRRRQRAEELARQAPIKMLPAIAFLIFPAIFIVLLGPAVIQVIQMFQGGMTF